jgi:DsbC/DsbD-like thiol-disulfide interchange protein
MNVNAYKQEANLQIKARVPRNACHKICVCCTKRHLGENNGKEQNPRDESIIFTTHFRASKICHRNLEDGIKIILSFKSRDSKTQKK